MLEADSEVWSTPNEMRVLVTGAAGFIGSHLVDYLLERGASVVGIDDLSRGARENLLSALGNPHFELRIASVSTPEGALRTFGNAPYDVAYLLAANSDISQSPKEPDADLNRTLLTTYETLRRCAPLVKRVVFASSSAIYGVVRGPITEGHGPLRPLSFYGAAKLASEAFLSAYANLYGIEVVCFRLPNVVGSRMTHGVVYDLVRKLCANPTSLLVLGDGSQRKPYLHVSDLVRALTWPIHVEPGVVEYFNVAGEGMTTVRKIVRMIIEELGNSDVHIEYAGGSGGWLGDVSEYFYDTTRIRSLGWHHTSHSDDAVRLGIREEIARWR